MVEDDKRIDRGENLFELTGEVKAAEKKMRQADRLRLQAKSEKADEDKNYLIQYLEMMINALDNSLNVKVANPEREILFTFNGRKFKIILSAPRT